MSIEEIFYKPAIVGATGGVLSLGLVSTQGRLFGINANISLGAVMMAASMVSATTKELVYEKALGKGQSNLVYSSTAPVITGLATVVAGYGIFGSEMTKEAAALLFGLGVAAEIGGDYVSDAILDL